MRFCVAFLILHVFWLGSPQGAAQSLALQTEGIPLSTLRQRIVANPDWIVPAWLRGGKPSWTSVGFEGAGPLGLMSHETEVQPGPEAFSCAGWVYLPETKHLATPRRELVLWRLHEGDLPMPFAHWRHEDILVRTNFFCADLGGKRINLARWSLYNEGKKPHEVCFYLAIRPYGVNGRFNPIHDASIDSTSVTINGRVVLLAREPPQQAGMIEMNQAIRPIWGEGSEYARRGEVPGADRLQSSEGLITILLKFRKAIPPRTTVPMDFFLPAPQTSLSPEEVKAIDVESQFARVANYWRQRVRTFTLQLPDERFAEASRASLAYRMILSSPATRNLHLNHNRNLNRSQSFSEEVSPITIKSTISSTMSGTREQMWQALRTYMDNQCAPGVYAWYDNFNEENVSCAGDFITGAGNARFISLLNAALVEESDDQLIIGPGIPEEWIFGTLPIRASGIDTRFGRLDYAITHNPRRRSITLELTGEVRPSRGFVFSLPRSRVVEGIKVDGVSMQTTGNEIGLPSGAKRVEVKYGRRR